MGHRGVLSVALAVCILNGDTPPVVTGSIQPAYPPNTKPPHFGRSTFARPSATRWPYPHYTHTRPTEPSDLYGRRTAPVTISPPVVIPPKCPEEQQRSPREISLTFSNVGLTNIGTDFVKSSDVVYLDLSGNKIESVSALAFNKTRLLYTLDLSDNSIPVNRLLSFSQVPNLRTLIVDENNGTNNAGERILSEYHEKMVRLTELSLAGNRIDTFNVVLKDLAPTLTRLRLSRNNIFSTEFLRNLPETLTHLYLDENSINAIPADHQDVLSNLIELGLRGNQIDSVCGDGCTTDRSVPLRKPTRLRKLDLSGNKIVEVAVDAFNQLRELVDLSLSDNRIELLRNGTFDGQQELEVLSLGRNRLAQIPDLCQTRRLKILDMSYNQIAEVNGARLCRSTSLKTLLLNNNRITSILTLETNSPLERLDLSHNRLIQLPGNWITPTGSPRVLFLNDNNITNLEELALAGTAQNMLELHLEGNPFTSVLASLFCNYPRKLEIYLKEKKSAAAAAPAAEDIETEPEDNERGNSDEDY